MKKSITHTTRAQVGSVLAVLVLCLAACGQADGEESPAVAVSVVDDGDTAQAEVTNAVPSSTASSGETTPPDAASDGTTSADPGTGGSAAGSPGAACRGAGFDFEPWLTICSAAQTYRAESLIDNPLDSVALTIPVQPGDRIADGLPADGAGFLGEGNETVAYTFELEAGDAVYVVPEGGGWSQGCSLGPPNKLVQFQVFAPDGTPLGARQNNDNCPRAAFAVPAVESGTYTLAVGAWADSVASTAGITTYSFTLSDVGFDRFGASLGEPIGPGSPAPGAGDIETEGSADVYTLPLAAGDEVIVNRIAFDGKCSLGPGPGLELTITAPNGEMLVERAFLTDNCSYEWTEPTIVADADGDYVIAVSGTSWHSTNKTVEYQIEFAPFLG